MDIDELTLKQQILVKIFSFESILLELEVHKNYYNVDLKSFKQDSYIRGIAEINLNMVNKRIGGYKDKIYKLKDQLYEL